MLSSQKCNVTNHGFAPLSIIKYTEMLLHYDFVLDYVAFVFHVVPEILESLRFTCYMPRQRELQKNTLGSHCWISHSRALTHHVNSTKSYLHFGRFAGDAILCSNFFCFLLFLGTLYLSEK